MRRFFEYPQHICFTGEIRKLSLNYTLFSLGMLQFTVGFILLERFFMGESFQDYS